jgi:hypothetical protein
MFYAERVIGYPKRVRFRATNKKLNLFHFKKKMRRPLWEVAALSKYRVVFFKNFKFFNSTHSSLNLKFLHFNGLINLYKPINKNYTITILAFPLEKYPITAFRGFVATYINFMHIYKNGLRIGHILKLLLLNFNKLLLNRGGLLGKTKSSTNLYFYQTLNDYFFSPNFFSKLNKNSRWLSMEEIINHFIFYSEGPSLPSGISQGGVEAPKGHLAVSVVSRGGNKAWRVRIRSSIQVMAGNITALTQGVALGDFVVIVSGSNIVVGEIDR